VLALAIRMAEVVQGVPVAAAEVVDSGVVVDFD